jgi:hypothetical protein
LPQSRRELLARHRTATATSGARTKNIFRRAIRYLLYVRGLAICPTQLPHLDETSKPFVSSQGSHDEKTPNDSRAAQKLEEAQQHRNVERVTLFNKG